MRHISLLAPGTLIAALIVANLSITPSSAAEKSDLLASSLALEAKGDFPGALHDTQIAAEQSPQSYFLRLRIAYLELSLKNYAEAARDYAKAASLAPRGVEALLGQQQALMALERHGDAENVANAILKRDPLNYLARSRLAWTQFSLKHYAESAKTYRAILDLYPADTEMAIGLGYAQLRAGHKHEAAETFASVLSMLPRDPRATAGLTASR